MTKILLDTDIGTDIDDSVCLAYLLSQPQCELLGITTVSGEPVKRAMLASAICKVAGKEVPIYPGVENPLLVHQHQPWAQQAKALGRWEHDTEFPMGQAITFMRDTIMANPGEVTLLAIGPLMNVALLFATYPETVKALKELVIMGGRFGNGLSDMPEAEWNILNDPHAAAIVYNAPLKKFRSIGLDVTMQIMMSRAEVHENFKARVLEPVKDFADVWFENAAYTTFHDPLAATCIFNDDICEFTPGTVHVELTAEEPLKGLTHFTKDENGAHLIATKVDRDAFIRHYFGVVNGNE